MSFPIISLLMILGFHSIVGNETPPKVKLAHREHFMSKYDYPFLDFSYFVNIFSDFGANVYTYNFTCSASLIAYHWSITAASCKLPIPYASYIIYAGIIPDPVIIINEYPGEYQRGQWRSISNWIVHPNYTTKNSLKNNIALLYLEVPFGTNIYIGFARLIPFSLFQGCDIALKYKSCQVPVYENKTLSLDNKFIFLTVFLNEFKFCQGNKSIRSEPYYICSQTDIEVNNRGCLGSLGSPLTCNKQQVGIMLNAYPCNESSKALYTRVDLYQKWIQTHVKVGLRYIENATFECNYGQALIFSHSTREESVAPAVCVNYSCLVYVTLVICLLTEIKP